MKPATFIRRHRWSLSILLCAVAAWPLVFRHLVDLRDPDVPFVTTPPDVVDKLLDLAETGPADTVYDLGSGDGRILIAAAKQRGARAMGVEIDPELVEKSREAIRAAGVADKVEVLRGDFFKQDLTPATVVTLYMPPSLNARLRPQLEQLKPGTRIVSHVFSIPGAKPNRKINVMSAETNMEHTLYLFTAPIEWEAK